MSHVQPFTPSAPDTKDPVGRVCDDASSLFPALNLSLLTIQGWLTVGFCAALPLKLSLAYSCLIPALALFWVNVYRGAVTIRGTWIKLHIPLVFFASYAGLAALLGLNPTKSLQSLFSLLSLSTTCFLIAWYVEKYRANGLLSAFLGAQGIAAINAVMALGSGDKIPRIFLGEVTQAGQFAIGLILGLSWLSAEQSSESFHEVFSQLRWGALLLFSCILVGFFGNSNTLPFGLSALGLLIVGRLLTIIRKRSAGEITHALCALWITLIGSGLIIDLKRGPWLGAWSGIVLLICGKKKKLFGIFLASSLIAAVVLQPVAHRLEATVDHFFIAGGRSVIWRIGAQLIEQFPLGIGLKNSSILRSFSHQIPPELTHFHSNLINLLVETGVIGAALYLWWVASICLASMKKGEGNWLVILPPVITWQIAGLVEYNIGDKEVILAVYLVIGVAYALLAQDYRESSAPARENMLS